MGTSTYTNTTTRTFTHTATHLAGVIASALAETLVAIGISVDKISRVYGYESAISAWIEQRSLASVRITITPPGAPSPPPTASRSTTPHGIRTRSFGNSSLGCVGSWRRNHGFRSERNSTSR